MLYMDLIPTGDSRKEQGKFLRNAQAWTKTVSGDVLYIDHSGLNMGIIGGKTVSVKDVVDFYTDAHGLEIEVSSGYGLTTNTHVFSQPVENIYTSRFFAKLNELLNY